MKVRVALTLMVVIEMGVLLVLLLSITMLALHIISNLKQIEILRAEIKLLKEVRSGFKILGF